MVATDRSNRNLRQQPGRSTEPTAPLAVLLAVIYKIAHIDEKGGFRIVTVSISGSLTPDIIIKALRIAEDQSCKSAAGICFQRLPGRKFFAAASPVFINSSRLQSCQRYTLLINRP